MDRRAAFFLGAALVSALLVPLTEAAQRWVPIALAVVYLLLAVASWADRRTKLRGRRPEQAPTGRPPDRLW
jgi:hypothetical protein